jgi:hypothetical protein
MIHLSMVTRRRRVQGKRRLGLVDAWHDSSLAGGMLATPRRNVLSPVEGRDGVVSLKRLGDARMLLLQRLKKRMCTQKGGSRGSGVQGCGYLTSIGGMVFSGGGHSCWRISLGMLLPLFTVLARPPSVDLLLMPQFLKIIRAFSLREVIRRFEIKPRLGP